MIFVVKYGSETEIAALGIGQTLKCILFTLGVVSFNRALDTLLSQGIGARNFRYCGLQMNRARFVVTAFALPTCVLLFYAEQILLMIG